MLGQLLRDIEEASRRAGEVLKVIRGMARKGKSDRRLLNLNPIVAILAPRAFRYFDPRDGSRYEFDSHLPDVEADPVQIQQVLLNLIMNALDAISLLPIAQRRMIIRTHRTEEFSARSVSETSARVCRQRDQRKSSIIFFHKSGRYGYG